MDVELIPGADFRELASKLRGAPADVRKELNAAIKDSTAPAEAALKKAVLNTQAKGSGGGGTRQRIEHARSRSKTGSAGRKPHGLRQSVARTITRKITYSGYRTGVRIRADASKMPPSQQKLPKLMNKGRWRHQVFGNGSYVTQTVSPVGWFDNTMKRFGPAAVKQIDEAARRAMEKLQ